ncbi:MAG: VWA domain-containing protein [Comamonadaceae bacterium]|nr:MAG: VWA domain-containing protein [Comamonadaceae bacterium]
MQRGLKARVAHPAPPTRQRASAELATRALDWPRTLVARGAGALEPGHLRHQRAPVPGSVLHCFVLDASASMVAGGRLAQAKGLLLHLLREAYLRRESVALICFGAGRVELRLPPQRAPAWSEAWIAPIPGGGGTPLALAVARAGDLLAARPEAQRHLWLLTDGGSPASPARPAAAEEAHIIDFEQRRVPLGRARALARAWGAGYRRLPADGV